MPTNLYGVPQPIPPAPQDGEYAVVGLATQANLNNDPITFRDVQLTAASLDTNIAGVGATGTEINGLPAGVYRVFGTLYLLSNTIRTNIILAPSINGVVQLQPRSANDYIRAGSGHNASSVHIVGALLTVPDLGSVGMMAQREANNGAVTSVGGQGQFSIQRVTL